MGELRYKNMHQNIINLLKTCLNILCNHLSPHLQTTWALVWQQHWLVEAARHMEVAVQLKSTSLHSVAVKWSLRNVLLCGRQFLLLSKSTTSYLAMSKQEVSLLHISLMTCLNSSLPSTYSWVFERAWHL